jgi:hypothetical protein
MKRILFGASVLILLSGLGLAGCRGKKDATESTRQTTGKILYRADSSGGGLLLYDHGTKTSTGISDPVSAVRSKGPANWEESAIKRGVMAYVKGVGENTSEIYFGRVGRELTKILTEDRRILEIEISPDLSQVAYIKQFETEQREELWKVDSTGRNKVLVSSDIPHIFFMEWLVLERIYAAEFSALLSGEEGGHQTGLRLSIDVTSGEVAQLPVPDVAIDNIGDVGFSEDGSRVAITTMGKMYVTDIENEETRHISSGPDESFFAPAFALDNRRVAYGHATGDKSVVDTDISLFDPASGETRRILDNPPAELSEEDGFPVASHALQDIVGWVSEEDLVYTFFTNENGEFTTELIVLNIVSKQKTLIESGSGIEVLAIYQGPSVSDSTPLATSAATPSPKEPQVTPTP